MKKLVTIVAQKDGWILEVIARQLQANLDYIVWSELPTSKTRITYYINYAQFGNERVSEIECALFTHLEEAVSGLVEKWHEVSNQVDVAVHMSKIYAQQFRKTRAQPIVIPPGVDLNQYSLKKLNIGVIGSAKKSGRKGERLIKAVMDLPNINWHFTGEGWPVKSVYYSDDEMPKLYQKLDYVLIASDYEGGPMCAIESLASGVPLISTEVGWVKDLPHIHIDKDKPDSLRKVLTKLLAERAALREAVINQTWDNFIHKHDLLFKRLLEIPVGEVNKKTVHKILRSL